MKTLQQQKKLPSVRKNDKQGKKNSNNLAYGNSRSQNAPSRQTIVQAQLELTTPGDSYEREADRMADFVMRKQQSDIPAEMPSTTSVFPPVISRHASSSSGIAVGASTESGIHASRGSGQALPTDLRTRMESSFGTDFSAVRLHTGNSAIQMNRDLQANAFTYGNDIFFNSGQYQPHTPQGQRLLAHELTHVVQQSGKVGREDWGGNNPYTTSYNADDTLQKKADECMRFIEDLSLNECSKNNINRNYESVPFEVVKICIDRYERMIADRIKINQYNAQKASEHFRDILKQEVEDTKDLILDSLTIVKGIASLIGVKLVDLAFDIAGIIIRRNFSSESEYSLQSTGDAMRNQNILDFVGNQFESALKEMIQMNKYEKIKSVIISYQNLKIAGEDQLLHLLLVEYAKQYNINTNKNRLYFDSENKKYISSSIWIKHYNGVSSYYTSTNEDYFLVKALNERITEEDQLFNRNRIEFHKKLLTDDMYFDKKHNRYIRFGCKNYKHLSLAVNVDVKYMGIDAITIGNEHNNSLHKKLISEARENLDIFFEPKTRKYSHFSFFEPDICKKLNILIDMEGNITEEEGYNIFLHKKLICEARKNFDIFFDPKIQKYRYSSFFEPDEVEKLNIIIKIDGVKNEDLNFNDEERMNLLKEYHELKEKNERIRKNNERMIQSSGFYDTLGLGG